MNRPVRILYIDDYPLDRELVRDALEKEHGGFEVVEAASRLDFETALAQGGFDLILSDFNILGFEGLQVLEAVRATDLHLPVIIVTGTGSEEIAAEAIKRGAADYVIKSPKHIQRLPHIIHAVLENKQLEYERKQAEAALRESQELFSLFMRHSPIYIFIKEVTPTGSRVLQASDNYRDMIGIPGSEMVGKTMAELFPAEFAAKITADDLEVVANGVVLKLDEDLNGRNYTSIKFPIIQEDKTLLAGYTIDITERKQAEEQLRESEEKFKYVFDHSVAGKSLTLPSGELNVNQAFCEMLGYSAEELKGRKWQEITHPEDVELTQNANNAMLSREKESMRFTKRFFHKNGSIVWADVATALRRDKDGRPLYFMTTILDITERKWAEEQIHQLNAELEQRVEERTRQLSQAQEKIVHQEKLAVLGQLAGGVGHELRNPLGVISNAVYYLKLVQPDADGKIKQYHDMIEQETLNAEKIITELLDYARIESMQRERVSVLELVQRTLTRYPVPETVHVTIKVPPGLPMAFADPRQVEQVLGNLVVNACQAMPGGGKLTISARGVKKELVAIVVKDTGTGVTPENMRKLFEPLFTTKARGIGLGLPVSQKLAEANGGRIEVKSEPGKGSTFTLVLPVGSF